MIFRKLYAENSSGTLLNHLFHNSFPKKGVVEWTTRA